MGRGKGGRKGKGEKQMVGKGDREGREREIRGRVRRG